MKNKYTHFICLILFLGSACQQSEYKLEDAPQKAELFAEGFISTSLYERDFAMSPDQTEIIYTLGDYKQSQRCLVSIQLEGDSWKEPQVLPFSGVHQDIEPFFSPEGNRLYFASNRPINSYSESNDYNIWFVDRLNDKWSEPQALDTLINTPGNEFYPAVTSSGNIYFTATRKDGIGREDIFVSKFINGQYQRPVALDSAINTLNYEFNAYVSPEEDLIVFSSFGREDDLGGGDLYVSYKDYEGNWKKAKHMGLRINSEKLDYCPFVDLENNVLYFTSERIHENLERISSVKAMIDYANMVQNGLGNIFHIVFDPSK
ncbi:MAG: exo-alpha-sialidase [Bacteroidota bacterium]